MMGGEGMGAGGVVIAPGFHHGADVALGYRDFTEIVRRLRVGECVTAQVIADRILNRIAGETAGTPPHEETIAIDFLPLPDSMKTEIAHQVQHRIPRWCLSAPIDPFA